MKLRLTKKKFSGGSLRTKDVRKRSRLLISLKNHSSKVRKEELSKQSPKTRTELTGFNKSGNNRGINLRDNPPSSEEASRRRAMRKFYNKQMPVLQCSNCAFSTQCPKFRAGYECAFLPFLNSHEVKSESDLVDYMKEMCGAGMRRAQLMLIAETLQGGAPSLETTEALGIAFNQLRDLHDTLNGREETSLELETEDGTIIGRLFGGLKNLLEDTKKSKENPIDVQSTLVAESDESELVDSQRPNVQTELVNDYVAQEPTMLRESLIADRIMSVGNVKI